MTTTGLWGFDMDWQLIETAPKDGIRFLAYEYSPTEYCCYECWWQDDFAEWEGWQNDWDSEPNPTHWMPLPKPPGETTSAIPEAGKSYLRNALMVGGWRGERE